LIDGRIGANGAKSSIATWIAGAEESFKAGTRSSSLLHDGIVGSSLLPELLKKPDDLVGCWALLK